MTIFSPRAERVDGFTPIKTLPRLNWSERQLPTLLNVSRFLLRRIKFMARFIYWTCKHGSTEHVRWVLAFEGYTW